MRRSCPLLLAAAVAAAFVPGALVTAAQPSAKRPAPPPAKRDRQASWDEQNHAMLYLIVHLSNINAANGLNLSREQAVKLRALAKRIEDVSAKPPDLTARYRGDLGEVRDTYVAVRDRLLACEPIDDALRKRVAAARALEASVVRLSIVEPGDRSAGCARCHREPKAADVRTMKGEAHKRAVRRGPRLPALDREIFLAHQAGVFGRRGIVAVAFAAPRVDRVLTTAQKAIVSDFTCCLLPPQDMGNPVRAGQAKSDEGHMKILRFVRDVPAKSWRAVQPRLMQWVDRLIVAYQPGADETLKKRVRKQVTDILARTRKLSDTDFELAKDKLAGELAAVAKTNAKLNDRQRRFMTASFLLVPGASKVYDRLIRRLDAAEEKTATR